MTTDTDGQHWIRPELTDQAIPIDNVQPMPGNPRIGNQTVIAQSLDVNQQYRPVLIQKSTGHIIAGNNTYHAACEAGWTHIAARYLDVTDEQAKRIAIVDNRANDLATYDDRLLAEFLSELPDLDGTGYEPGDLTALESSLTVPDLDDLADEVGEPKPDDGWPSINVRVPHTVKAAWNSHLSTYNDDASRAMAVLLGVDLDVIEGDT